MGAIRPHAPWVMPMVAVFSQREELMDQTTTWLVDQLGPLWRASPRFDFSSFTSYYQAEMGDRLIKQLLVFETLKPASFLPPAKIQTNAWEHARTQQLQAGPTSLASPISRPINIDPGYLTLAKLVLASTKEHAHRIYLDEGIFGEVTLWFQDGDWHANSWTYPDYKSEELQQFLHEARHHLKLRLRSMPKVSKKG